MPKTVLIVDDHPGFRRSARRLLEAEGYAVVAEAPDATTALRLVDELAPDVVLLDVRLPDGDGFTLASRLCKTEASPAVVLVSSHDRLDFGDEIADSPASGFITKVELSAETLETALHRRRIPPGSVA